MLAELSPNALVTLKAMYLRKNEPSLPNPFTPSGFCAFMSKNGMIYKCNDYLNVEAALSK
jgi:hypothetical protein